MERTDIEKVVVTHAADVLELDPEEITTESSMVDLGANSLDIVEVVSLTMRELRIKVPRSELEDLENMSQLVDLLYHVKQQSLAA